MYLVLIETSGNQNFIFSTNKLRENVGASELTHRAGTRWILEAVDKVSNSGLWSDNDQLREKLLDRNLNKPIDSFNDVKVEVIVATSGKALLLTQDSETAKSLIQYVTHKALREAPGLDICGVISEPFDWEKDGLGQINRKVHQKFESVRSQKPSPDLRFLRLPVVDECSTSGLPASRIEQDTEKSIPRSAVSYSKRGYRSAGFERIAALLRREKPNIDFAWSIRVLLDEELSDEELPDEPGIGDIEDSTNRERQSHQLEWLSVVHADGNGLGEIFLDFDKYIKNSKVDCSQANRNYVDRLRRFSIALDVCTEKAFLSALDAFTPTSGGLVPVVPLVLGGDDLTVVCDGKSALQFTHLFLKEFENQTASPDHCDGIIPEIAEKALGVGRLSACAGVAIIKRHFPFSVAYELSEKLVKSAKQVKKKVISAQTNKQYPCSALDFHVLYDSSDVELDKIRSKLQINNGTEKSQLYKRPYVVTPQAELQGAVKNPAWAEVRGWQSLKERVLLLIDTEDGRRKLPNSQMHDLRTGLFFGKDGADRRFWLIRNRYIEKGIDKLEDAPSSLFQKEPGSGIYITGLLDAMDAADFLENQGEVYE
jgi:hypothetical protein